MKHPIYVPKGRAREYGDHTVNIYDGCSHGCAYCYAQAMAKRFGRHWSALPIARAGIVEAVKEQLQEDATFVRAAPNQRKRIHLCFACDPYPTGVDTTPTRSVIQAIKKSGHHVQILTKAGREVMRDFDLLDAQDWVGVTISGAHHLEPNAAHPFERLDLLQEAKRRGFHTWVSFEPVLDPEPILLLIRYHEYIDTFKIGKLNHLSMAALGLRSIDWGAFGRMCEKECRLLGRDFYIKEDLRKEMAVGE